MEHCIRILFTTILLVFSCIIAGKIKKKEKDVVLTLILKGN